MVALASAAEPAVDVEAMPICGAKTRSGTPCTQDAGWGTSHVGQGKCKLHGGASLIKHGRYSRIVRPRIAELYGQHFEDPAPLDTHPEIALARALLQDFIERYDAFAPALIAWHESWKAGNVPLAPAKVLALRAVLDEYEELVQGGDGLSEKQTATLAEARACVDRLEAGAGASDGKPHQVLDIADAVRMLGEVTKMVERVERTRAANAISRGDFLRVMSAMGQVVEAYVRDRATQEKIRDGWLQIRAA